MAEPGDVAALNVLVLAQLKQVVPKYRHGVSNGFGLSPIKLLGAGMEMLWTGHSERATLTSGLAALGVGREERDPLGRWSAEGSDVYVRGYKGLVRRLVEKFVGAARVKEGYEALDEGDAVTELAKVFEKRGIGPGEGKAMRARLLAAAKSFFEGLPCREEFAGETVVEKEANSGKVILGNREGSDDEKDDFEEGGYIASSSQRGTRVMLHKAVGCWRTLRLCFGEYQVLPLGTALEAGGFTGYCRDCWRGEAPPFEVASSSNCSASEDSQSDS